jgi:hypothetical protein
MYVRTDTALETCHLKINYSNIRIYKNRQYAYNQEHRNSIHRERVWLSACLVGLVSSNGLSPRRVKLDA